MNNKLNGKVLLGLVATGSVVTGIDSDVLAKELSDVKSSNKLEPVSLTAKIKLSSEFENDMFKPKDKLTSDVFKSNVEIKDILPEVKSDDKVQELLDTKLSNLEIDLTEQAVIVEHKTKEIVAKEEAEKKKQEDAAKEKALEAEKKKQEEVQAALTTRQYNSASTVQVQQVITTTVEPPKQTVEVMKSVTAPSSKAQAIYNAAMSQIGVMQDCTMLVTNSLRTVGINHHSWPIGYMNLGTVVSYEDAQPGDLIYYANGGMGFAHIAVYAGNGQAIHGGWNGNQTVVASAFVGSGPVFIRVA